MLKSLSLPPEPPPNLPLSFGQILLRFVGIVPGDVPRGLVPFYHFQILTKGLATAGHINFRVGDNEHVLLVAGHIGYEVMKQHRGHGYAYEACRAIGPFVRTIYPAVIITADPDNHASIRTIERLGAAFVDEIPVPLHDPHFQRGSRSKRRTQWKP